jgi:hypothetical protein
MDSARATAYVNFIKLVVNWTDNFRIFVMKITDCGRSMRKFLAFVFSHVEHNERTSDGERDRGDDAA